MRPVRRHPADGSRLLLERLVVGIGPLQRRVLPLRAAQDVALVEDDVGLDSGAPQELGVDVAVVRDIADVDDALHAPVSLRRNDTTANCRTSRTVDHSNACVTRSSAGNVRTMGTLIRASSQSGLTWMKVAMPPTAAATASTSATRRCSNGAGSSCSER